MAKEISAADVAAFFAARGVQVTEDISNALSSVAENEIKDATYVAIRESMVPLSAEDEAKAPERKKFNERNTAWQERLFDLANDVHEQMVSEVRNAGRGQNHHQEVSIETPNGRLYVKLTRAVEK